MNKYKIIKKFNTPCFRLKEPYDTVNRRIAYPVQTSLFALSSQHQSISRIILLELRNDNP